MSEEMKSEKRKKLLLAALLVVLLLYFCWLFFTGYIDTCAASISLAAGTVALLALGVKLGEVPKGSLRYVWLLALVFVAYFLIQMLSKRC